MCRYIECDLTFWFIFLCILTFYLSRATLCMHACNRIFQELPAIAISVNTPHIHTLVLANHDVYTPVCDCVSYNHPAYIRVHTHTHTHTHTADTYEYALGWPYIHVYILGVWPYIWRSSHLSLAHTQCTRRHKCLCLTLALSTSSSCWSRMLVVNITAQPNQQRYWAATTQGTCRAGQNHIYIYGVHTAFLAGKSPNIRSYTVYIYSSGQPYIYGSGQIHNHVQHLQQWTWLGLARTICIWCTYGIFGREITKFTVIYGVYIQFWPTLGTCLRTSSMSTSGW
jgi:hypothetical protein